MASELHLGDSNWKFVQVGYPVDTPTNIKQTHTSLDIHLKDNQTVRSTKAFHNVEKEEEQQDTVRLGDICLGLSPSPPSSVSGTSVSGASVSTPSVSGTSVFETAKVKTNGTDGYSRDGKT